MKASLKRGEKTDLEETQFECSRTFLQKSVFMPMNTLARRLPGRKFSHVRDGPVSYDIVYDYDYGQQTFRIMRHMPIIGMFWFHTRIPLY